ncbi:hypothetical protein LTR85_000739 [Meristemomyces frigidus]|nr:hypothetical protein LTR85_000739 [Meristemomyces frigidus]
MASRLRKMISSAVDKKTKVWMTQLTEEVLSTRAELTLASIDKREATEALHQEKKRGKRGKKLMGDFRALEVRSRKAVELKERRGQAVEERYQEKQLKIQEKAAQKAVKEQEAQRKRSDRAMAAQARVEAKAQKQADRLMAKEAKEAQKQLEIQSKASVSKPRERPREQLVAPVVTVEEDELEIGVVSKQAGSRSG